GVRAYWRRWLSAWEDVAATEVEFVDGGQTVVALIHQQRLRGRGSGIEVDTRRTRLPLCSGTERSYGGSSIRRRQKPSKPPGCRSRRCRVRTSRSCAPSTRRSTGATGMPCFATPIQKLRSVPQRWD